MALAQKTKPGIPTSDPTPYTWKSLGEPGVDYVELCYRDCNNDGTCFYICTDSCPDPTSNICAEFSDSNGNVSNTCCIPRIREGSTNPADCLADVSLVRSPEPQE